MKYKKSFLLLAVISILFSSTVFSQSLHFHDSVKNNTDRLESFYNYEQIGVFESNQLLKSNIITEGSPFNNNDNPQIDSVIIKMTDTDIDTIKYYYTYDLLGNVASVTKTNNYRAFYEYDLHGNIITELWQFWVNDQWVNDTFISNTYDSTGKRILYLNQRWNNSVWLNSYRVEYFYDLDGKLNSYLLEDWDGSGWVNSFRVTNTYDSNNFLIQSLQQNWGGNDWDGYTWRDTYTYDLIGNQIYHVIEVLTDNNWIKRGRWRDEYDEYNNRIFEYYDTYEENEWNDYYKWSFSYNEDGNVVYYLEEVFDSVKWISTYQTFSTYNKEGYFSYARSERWLEYDSVWVPGNEGVFIYDKAGNRRSYFGAEIKVYYHYETTNINTKTYLQEDFYLSQNYPNPFNPTTKIKYSIIDKQNRGSVLVKLKVYNLLGEEITTLVDKEQKPGFYEIRFDGSLLPSGIYIYNLKSDDFNKSKKMILIK